MSNLATSISLRSGCNTFTMSESHTYPPVSTNDFRSNVVPSTEDHARISKIIADEERELAVYDKEITRLRRIIDQLESDRSTLQTRITQRRSFISSRRRLPSELWFDIFELACGSKKYSLFVDYNSTVKVALPSVLSQVSTQWRGILESRPHLWSSISIDITRLKFGIYALLEQYLRNAADSPLTVKVVYGGPSDRKSIPPNSIDAFQLLFRNIARCKTFNLVNHHNAELMPLVPVPSTTISFPLMQSITMYSTSYEENPQFWDNVRVAPRLTHAAIVGLSSLRFLPLRRLVSLDIQSVTPSESILDILRECSSLRTLKIKGLELRNLNIGPADQPLTITSLQNLSLDFGEHTNDLENLLRALVLPSLNSLVLLNTRQDWRITIFQVVPLLLPFSQSLAKVTFNLGHMRLPRGSILQIFRTLPRLTDFEICYSGETEAEGAVAIAHELIRVLDAHSLVAPRLRSLRLREHKGRFELKLVKAAVALLEGQVRPLKCIELRFSSTVVGRDLWLPTGLLARMRNLKEHGKECIVEFVRADFVSGI